MFKPDLFNRVVIGEAKQYENMMVYPLFSVEDGRNEYLTLDEALKQNLIKITEVDEEGTISELKVENFADLPILILEGEELIGAKQNRTINTTILIKEKTTTLIPVSCVEQGRWDYETREFSRHEFITPTYLRARKVASVTKSVLRKEGFHSDQKLVWSSVSDILTSFNATSSSKAVDDAYVTMRNKQDDYINIFKYEDGQNGIIVFSNGRIAGVEYISLKRAYKIYHSAFIAGYAINSIFETKQGKTEGGYRTIDELISEFDKYQWKITKSVGLGDDIRFMSDNYVAAGLIYRDELIQMSILNNHNKRDWKVRW
ncbi:MAG: DUF6569 family protein [Candidatus Kryptonium sp.]